MPIIYKRNIINRAINFKIHTEVDTMAVESIIRNTAANMAVKPVENKPVSIEPVAAAAVEMSVPVKEVQGSKQNMQEGSEGEGKEKQQASKKQIASAVNHANSKLKKTGCQFSYHEETKRVSIKVIDKETNEVIREIPPEETLEMVEKMWELAGILVDEKR